VNGTTSTVDLDVGVVWVFRSDVDVELGESRRSACEVAVGTRLSRMMTSFESEREEGIGMVWDARRTGYCRSQRRRTISRFGGLVVAARRT
jgi:hypothetical protein